MRESYPAMVYVEAEGEVTPVKELIEQLHSDLEEESEEGGGKRMDEISIDASPAHE